MAVEQSSILLLLLFAALTYRNPKRWRTHSTTLNSRETERHFSNGEVRRLEAELHQREQDYEDLLKEAKEICQIQVQFQDSTEKIIESKDQEIASLTRELERERRNGRKRPDN